MIPETRRPLASSAGHLHALPPGSVTVRYMERDGRRLLATKLPDGTWKGAGAPMTAETLIAIGPVPAVDQLLAIHTHHGWGLYRATFLWDALEPPKAGGRIRRWDLTALNGASPVPRYLERHHDRELFWFESARTSHPLAEPAAWAFGAKVLSDWSVRGAEAQIRRFGSAAQELDASQSDRIAWWIVQRGAPDVVASAAAVIGWVQARAVFLEAYRAEAVPVPAPETPNQAIRLSVLRKALMMNPRRIHFQGAEGPRCGVTPGPSDLVLERLEGLGLEAWTCDTCQELA